MWINLLVSSDYLNSSKSIIVQLNTLVFVPIHINKQLFLFIFN